MKKNKVSGLNNENPLIIKKPDKVAFNRSERSDYYVDVANGQLPKFTQLAVKLLVKIVPAPGKSGYMMAHLLATDQEVYDLGFRMGTPDKY